LLTTLSFSTSSSACPSPSHQYPHNLWCCLSQLTLMFNMSSTADGKQHSGIRGYLPTPLTIITHPVQWELLAMGAHRLHLTNTLGLGLLSGIHHQHAAWTVPLPQICFIIHQCKLAVIWNERSSHFEKWFCLWV
jgi:hypothetical protein